MERHEREIAGADRRVAERTRLAVAQRRDAAHGHNDLARPRGPVDLAQRLDSAPDGAGVARVEVVADLPPARELAHRPARDIADHDAELAHVRIALHQGPMLRSGARDRRGDVVGRAGRALEHEALVCPLVAVVRLGHAVPHVDPLFEDRLDRGARVDRQVAPQPARSRPHPRPAQQQRRVDRAVRMEHDMVAAVRRFHEELSLTTEFLFVGMRLPPQRSFFAARSWLCLCIKIPLDTPPPRLVMVNPAIGTIEYWYARNVPDSRIRRISVSFDARILATAPASRSGRSPRPRPDLLGGWRSSSLRSRIWKMIVRC